MAVARYFAHSPAERAALQTADISCRLLRGGELHQAAAQRRRTPTAHSATPAFPLVARFN